MPGAVEIGRELDVIRRKIRRRCHRMDGLRGDSTVDRIIDSVVAPLVLGFYDGHGLNASDVAKAVGDDLLSVFSRPPQRTLPARG